MAAAAKAARYHRELLARLRAARGQAVGRSARLRQPHCCFQGRNRLDAESVLKLPSKKSVNKSLRIPSRRFNEHPLRYQIYFRLFFNVRTLLLCY